MIRLHALMDKGIEVSKDLRGGPWEALWLATPRQVHDGNAAGAIIKGEERIVAEAARDEANG